MPRRRNKAHEELIGIALLFGLVAWVASAIRNSSGIILLIVPCVIAVAFAVWYLKRKARIEYLTGKYGDPSIVALIMQHRYWQGQTSEQLVDSLGNPLAKDDKLLKTRKREVWKYNRTGVNRYGLRITLDNDIVTGWDQKR
jgi:hypothetical protein